jgi:hypothetical protein
MSRGETALADRRREIDVPTRVEKVPYLSPGAVVHEQVVAFGDDERHEAFDGDGDRRLARTRRSGDAEDGLAALSEQPPGEFGQAVHRRFHAEILSPRSFESLE